MKFLPEGDSFLTISRNAEVKIWEVKSLKPRQTFTLCDVEGMSVAFSSDMHRVFFGTPEGSIKLCGSQTGPEPLTLVSEPGGWLTMTPAGFFSAAFKGPDLLSVVRGLEVTTIGQVHQSLFNPDLVHEAVSGDPDGEVKRAAEVINLDKVLGSGPAPAVEISSGPSEARSDTDLITVSAHIRDRGKGIGRIEWRVNGITVGVANPPPGAGPDYETKRELALDPGENVIEVVAYNARNLLASPPAQTKIVYTGRGDTVKPKLHVLAIGINAYEDKGWTDPRTSETMLFRPLGLAAADATALAAEMKTAAAGLYSEVRIRTAIDREATAAGLDRIVQDMSREMSARDTFVLFAAAHGYSLNGRFYLIPQDYQGGSNPDALASKAIAQELCRIGSLIASKPGKPSSSLIHASLGTLTGGYARSRVDVPASEAAVGHLHEATGRPILTATAAGQEALELPRLATASSPRLSSTPSIMATGMVTASSRFRTCHPRSGTRAEAYAR